jgi:peptidoglycan/xylan/chitin deacetylase (PgdA/CDA1 family)
MMTVRRAAAILVSVVLAGLLFGACRKQQPQQAAPTAAEAPLPTKTVQPRNIPILCMHDIGPDARNAYSIKTADLWKYVRWLHDQGFQSVTVRDVAAYIHGEKELPEKPVVLTFDDNWKSALKIAKPALDKYGYVGVAFVISSSVGANERRLTWDDCKQLAEAGWEIGCHSQTHENLTRVPKGEAPDSIHGMVEAQIRDSKAGIERHTGLEVTSFALPFGNYDTFVLETLRDAGYTAAVSIDRATADEQSGPFCLPRRMIMNRTAFSTFQRVCQAKTLHLADLAPPPGTRVQGPSVTVTGTLSDDDVSVAPTGEVLGKPLDVRFDSATKKITFTAKLQRGANSFALRVPGRETSWLLISDG